MSGMSWVNQAKKMVRYQHWAGTLPEKWQMTDSHESAGQLRDLNK
jgi:hypothetical protein